MNQTLRILHLEDEPLDSEIAVERLNADGVPTELDRIDTWSALRAALDRGHYDLVLSDYTLPGMDPLEGLRLVRQLRPELPFIFFSGTIGEERATQAMKLGANDYVLKQRPEQLTPTVRRAVAEARELALRKQAEQALRHSEQRMRLAQEVAQIGTFEWNVQTDTTQWSPEMEALHGLAPGTFVGTHDAWRQYVHPDDLPHAERILEQAIQHGSFEGEWRVRWPTGQIRWLAVRGRIFPDEAGQPLRMVGVNIDITERRRHEEALKAARVTAERARATAEEANLAKDRFIAILSHELRTPLTAVLPALDAIEPLVNAEARDYLQMATRNVELEVRLIDDLLDVTRIAQGKIELHREPVDLCAILRLAAEVCQDDITARGMHFALRVDEAPHMVDADPARLQQILWNLIKNAVKFTPANGCIGVYARRQDGRSVVEVHDSGAGIESEALARIFNAFEQEAKSITRQFGGLGLGLAISKTLTELHGGTIRVTSGGRGKGASFFVEFPLLTARPASAPATVAGSLAAATPATPDRKPKTANLRILLVEDHPDTARILSLLLRRVGHQVQHAADLATALRVARDGSFDVIVSDLGLPDGSGYDLMQQLVSWGRHLPAIALSGYGAPADIARSHAAGFIEHIIKPVSFPALQAALARVMLRRE